MEEFTIEDQANYYSGITCVTVNGKRAYELKGKFLDDLCDNAFNGTNEEDAVEHIDYFLKIVDPINLPNVNHERFSFSTFLISLIGNAVKWFDEFKGSITTWVDLTENNFKQYYPTSRSCNVVGTEAIRDPTNTTFEEWRDDQEGAFDEGFFDVEEANNEDEQETTKIFRIETNLFDYETPDGYASNSNDVQMEREDKERCDLLDDTTRDASVYKVRKFEMIKYSFGQDEEYVAIKEFEYNDLTRTNEDACRAYQEIFRNMYEGWVVTRAE
ncbi:hypothetical protein Tco_0881639 [Tanacetum coccineum]